MNRLKATAAAALAGAVLLFAGVDACAQAATQPQATEQNAWRPDEGFFDEDTRYEEVEKRQGFEERFREVTAVPGNRAVEIYVEVLLTLTLLVALLIFVSGVDDAFIDAYYWLRGIWRRKISIGDANSRYSLERLLHRPEAPFAIMVPAWKEHEVIAAMIENTVRTLNYRAYRIFCGVYRNDPATAREVDRMALRHPGMVTRVEVPHDGPTCKADCLNYIVRHVLEEGFANGTAFAGMVLHDSEDVIHPLELKLFNVLAPAEDLVQLPVFSLARPWHQLTGSTYIDDFAEAHGKDMAVRESLVGTVPGAGVATCYSARAMALLWRASGGEPFNTASLTEDYDLSFRLRTLGMRQTFAHVAVHLDGFRVTQVPGRTGTVIATHEYFPERFRSAYRQRARWVIGIAFQGWQQLGWRGNLRERYFLFRDRKALVMAPAGALAYLLLANFLAAGAFGSYDVYSRVEGMLTLPGVATLLLINLAFMTNRAVQRMYFVGRYYGAMQGLLSVVRMPVNNLVNLFAVLRAWRLFLAHLRTGKRLAWDKTAHTYPAAVAAQLSPVAAQASAPAAVRAGAAPKLFAALALAATVLSMLPLDAAAAPELQGRAYELADQAYKAIDANQLDRALSLTGEALQLAPGHPALLLIQADILNRQDKPKQAIELVRGLSPQELGGQGLAQRGYIWLKVPDDSAAEADFTAALKSPDLDRAARANIASELAYLALRRKDDATALQWFERAAEGTPSGAAKGRLYADAGYAAMRLARNRVAVDMLSRSIDEWHAAPASDKPFDDASLYGMRRSIDSMSRRWGFQASIGHSATTPGSGLIPTSGHRALQGGLEAFYTPEFGFRDGRIFQLYANAFQTLTSSDPDFATGNESRVVGIGARYKPFREENLILALERREAVGSRAGEDDWLLRAGYSASRNTDWEPTRKAWWSGQLYTEAVYFTRASRVIVPFDARVGRSWKLDAMPSTVVTPFIGIAGDYDKAQAQRTAAGIGPGLMLRHWFRESRYRAFSSYLDFSLQYRYRVSDAERGQGLFGQLMLSF